MSEEKYVNDPVLGRLRWDDKYTLFGDMEYAPGQRVRVVVDADFEESDLDEVMQVVREAFLMFRRNEGRHRLRTAAALNADREGDSPKHSDEDVANSLLITHLNLDEEGDVRVGWGACATLGGRAARSRIDRYGRFVEARMLGPDGE